MVLRAGLGARGPDPFLFLGYPKTFGVFLFPAIFLAIGGFGLADARLPETSRLFGTIHASALLAATVFLCRFVIKLCFCNGQDQEQNRFSAREFPSRVSNGLEKPIAFHPHFSLYAIGVFFGLVLCYASTPCMLPSRAT